MRSVPVLPGVLPPPLFVDWHGVLCRDGFWFSITDNPRHPYRREIQRLRASLFSQVDLVEGWMRGEVSTRKLLVRVQAQAKLDARANPDFLLRRFERDCRQFRLNTELVEALRYLRNSSSIVIATDNMDLPTDVMSSRADVWDFADDILSSSDIGVLKYESPSAFFGPWLGSNGFSFSQALLIDDNLENCIAFEKVGGRALHWRPSSTVEDAVDFVKGFRSANRVGSPSAPESSAPQSKSCNDWILVK